MNLIELQTIKLFDQQTTGAIQLLNIYILVQCPHCSYNRLMGLIRALLLRCHRASYRLHDISYDKSCEQMRFDSHTNKGIINSLKFTLSPRSSGLATRWDPFVSIYCGFDCIHFDKCTSSIMAIKLLTHTISIKVQLNRSFGRREHLPRCLDSQGCHLKYLYVHRASSLRFGKQKFPLPSIRILIPFCFYCDGCNINRLHNGKVWRNNEPLHGNVMKMLIWMLWRRRKKKQAICVVQQQRFIIVSTAKLIASHFGWLPFAHRTTFPLAESQSFLFV